MLQKARWIYRWTDGFVERETQLDGDTGNHARAFLFFLLVVYAVEGLCNAILLRDRLIPSNLVEPVAGLLALLAYGMTPYRRGLCAVLCATVLFRLITTFPLGANHAYLFALQFGLFALCDVKDERERAWVVGGLKFVALLILFYTGLQKLLHGHYGQGELFAVMIRGSESFRKFFALILPASEIERLMQYEFEEGAGPFRLQTQAGVWIARGSYTAELVLPLALVDRRLRTVGVAGCVGLILLIEAAAREITFGLVFLNLCFLYLPGPLHWRLRWVAVAAGASMLLLRLLGAFQIIPEVHFG